MRKFVILSLLLLALPALAITWTRHEVRPGVSAEFPGKPENLDGQFVYFNGGDRLQLSASDLDLPRADALVNLETNLKHFAADYDGKIASKTRIEKGDFTGYRFKVSGGERTIDSVWVVDGNIWLMANGHHAGAKSAVTEHFLDSLRYTK